MFKVSYLQEKVSSLAERLSELKDHLIDTAAQAVTAFKEKMVDVLTSYEKTANQIDSITQWSYKGNEYAHKESHCGAEKEP